MNDKTRRTVRTVLQVVLALALAMPLLVEQAGLDTTQVRWLGVVVAAAAVVARLMQSNVVEALLQRYVGGLAANSPTRPVDPGA